MRSEQILATSTTRRVPWWLVPVALGVVLLGLFGQNILPGHILFSNDGPLGANATRAMEMPSAFKAVWSDANAFGNYSGNVFLPVTGTLLWVLGPVFFAKLYAALVLLLLGCCAGYFYRQMKLGPAACVVGALATALNSTFFSSACWGIAAHEVAIATSFLAMGLVVGGKGWVRLVLAGLAVGVGVMEAADVGAILSLYVAAFILYASLREEGPTGGKAARGVFKVAAVAIFAGIMATHSIAGLISTQIKGVAGTQQDLQTKQERWDFATQWSLTKRETLGLIAPGLFGYRMDTPNGGAYWGAMGRDPNWYHWYDNGKQGPEPSTRGFSGGGIYAGALVALIAFWAALQSFRKEDSVFNLHERRMIWFWVGVIVLSLPLSYGRFAPFYQCLYALPYFSTIRNPGKFLFPTSIAIVVLFAYGVHGLWRRYMETAPGVAVVPYAGVAATWKTWWQRVRGFDRKWTIWSFVAVGVAALGWLIYASSRQGLETYLQQLFASWPDNPTAADPTYVAQVASFSSVSMAKFALTLGLAVTLIALILAGVFRGPRAKWGGILLGLFVVVDLGRANLPWIIVWDYPHKYATNPIIDFLKEKPYEHRVAILPRNFTGVFNVPRELAQAEGLLDYLYGIEWSQHLFLYYNIQSLDIIQMPRMAEDFLAYDRLNFHPTKGTDLWQIARKWQLTNTRYLIGAAAFVDVMNQTLDPANKSFKAAERFAIAAKPGTERSNSPQDWTAVPDTNGPFAVIEFGAALPRAKLYSTWELEMDSAAAAAQVQSQALGPLEKEILKHAGTNGLVTLRRLASESFDPQKNVIVGAGSQGLTGLSTQTSALAGTTNTTAGQVDFTSYAPKNFVLKADAAAPSILLVNDRYDPNWKVLVDGKPAVLLRCNYIMRGVHLTPGAHAIEFKFEPPMGSFYVSLAAVVLGVLLVGYLAVQSAREKKPEKPTVGRN